MHLTEREQLEQEMFGVHHGRVPPATYRKHLSWERRYYLFPVTAGCLL